MANFGTGPDGRLFTGARSQELPKLTYMRAWRAARRIASVPEIAAGPLAATPYALRDAFVPTWLNGGVPAPQVAEWAGHSVDALLKVYAKCIDGQDVIARRRVMQALGHPDGSQAAARHCLGTHWAQTADACRYVPMTAGHNKIDPSPC
jgi:integrase